MVLNYRIHEVLKEKLSIVDVDGSYLLRKEQRLVSEGVQTLPLSAPAVPLSGWELLTRDNYKELGIPTVTSGMPESH